MSKIIKAEQGTSFIKGIFKPEYSNLLILIVMLTLTAVLQKNFEIKAIVRNINAFMPLILLPWVGLSLLFLAV